MDSTRQAVVSNSPHSSRGIDINPQDSPVTSLSAFSAGQYRVAKNTNLTNVEGAATPNSPLGAEHYLPGFLTSSNVVRQFSSRLHDPFVASPGCNQKLSPTACAFEPLASSRGDHNGYSALNGTMGALASADYPKSVSHVENSARARDFLNATIASTPSRGGFTSNELNADDNSTRYLVVSGIDKTTAPKELREFFTVSLFFYHSLVHPLLFPHCRILLAYVFPPLHTTSGIHFCIKQASLSFILHFCLLRGLLCVFMHLSERIRMQHLAFLLPQSRVPTSSLVFRFEVSEFPYKSIPLP
jgi:hypothetical protein